MNSPAFRPNRERYLVLPDEAPDESTQIGDMLIEKLKDAHQKPSEGRVAAIGKDCTEYAVGDKVFYGKYSGYDQTFEGATYKILQQGEILGSRIETPFDEQPYQPLGVFNSGDLPVLRCRNENGAGSQTFCDLPYGHVGHHEQADPGGSGGSIGWTNYDDMPF